MIYKNIILSVLLFTTFLSAKSIYNTEGIKNVNVKVMGKSKFITKEFKQKIQADIIKELQKVGIQTKNDEFSTLGVKIEIVDLKKTQVINVRFFLIEDVTPLRDTNIEGLGITYQRNDMFEVIDEVEIDIYESVFKLLLPNFIEQHKEENS
jgi:hypothetical protein